jgi:hypothetical protein
MSLEIEALTAATNLQAAKDIIKASIAQSTEVNAKYGWAAPIVNETTEQYIGRQLTDQPPASIHKVQPLSENLNLAGAAIEQALARQERIYELEIAAVNAILDDLAFEATSEASFKIAVASLKADAAQYPQTANDPTESDVRTLFDTKQKIFDLKVASRSTKGSALNLGERVAFLRTFQADTIRTIYERLAPARLCLASSGLGKPKKLPAWDPKGGLDNLRNLALWVRDAIRSVETSLPRERVTNVWFASYEDGVRCYDTNDVPLSKTDLLGRLATPGYDDIKFDFDQTLIDTRIAYRGFKYARLVGAGVGIVFDEDFDQIRTLVQNSGDVSSANARREIIRDWRNRLRFAVKLAPPMQVCAFRTGLRTKAGLLNGLKWTRM